MSCNQSVNDVSLDMININPDQIIEVAHISEEQEFSTHVLKGYRYNSFAMDFLGQRVFQKFEPKLEERQSLEFIMSKKLSNTYFKRNQIILKTLEDKKEISLVDLQQKFDKNSECLDKKSVNFSNISKSTPTD